LVQIVRNAPLAFHLMAKPVGGLCNLNCKYCFYLPKTTLYPGRRLRMNDELLETYLRQYIGAQQVPDVTISWQGGEPTLIGLDFFKRSVEYTRRLARPGMRIQHTLQTNGTLLNDEWCRFFRENNFLVGLSLDGPRELHDYYRVDKAGAPTFDRVIRAARLMQNHKVEFNVLCTVHAANAEHSLKVYRFFRDELTARWVQFIPIVERINPDGSTFLQEGNTVTDRSVKPDQWGKFLLTIFDEWVRRDVGEMHVNVFEAALASWVGFPATMCIFDETCGKALALEHNGDIYSCDHFVEPGHLLGNIKDQNLEELVASDKQCKFGNDKYALLPRQCLECDVRFACNGECPKNRFILTPDGEPGLSYLCAGYKAFFNHIGRPMRTMAQLYTRGRPPAEIMSILAFEDARASVVRS
jgi:uncharacterized protein